jgi:hypothetical protein
MKEECKSNSRPRGLDVGSPCPQLAWGPYQIYPCPCPQAPSSQVRLVFSPWFATHQGSNSDARTFFCIFQDLPALCVKW